MRRTLAARNGQHAPSTSLHAAAGAHGGAASTTAQSTTRNATKAASAATTTAPGDRRRGLLLSAGVISCPGIAACGTSNAPPQPAAIVDVHGTRDDEAYEKIGHKHERHALY